MGGGGVLILKSAWVVLSTLYYWAWGVLSAFKKHAVVFVHISQNGRGVFLKMCCKKVQVGKDQEKAQSEKDPHSKNRGGKKTKLRIRYLYHKHIVSRMSSYFPNRWPLSYLN